MQFLQEAKAEIDQSAPATPSCRLRADGEERIWPAINLMQQAGTASSARSFSPIVLEIAGLSGGVELCAALLDRRALDSGDR